MRGRFGNALHWYAALIDTKNLCMRDYLNNVRQSVLEMNLNPKDENMDIDGMLEILSVYTCLVDYGSIR